ncbi:MAG: hypothetical protein R2867_36435 [Caldilineaceae bacterium]
MSKHDFTKFCHSWCQKASTTSLYYYLDQHPQIFMSPIKEPKFLPMIRATPMREWDHNRFPVRTLSDYEMLYADANGRTLLVKLHHYILIVSLPWSKWHS